MHRSITSLILAMVTTWVVGGPLLFAGTASDQQTYVVTVRPDASIDGIRAIAKQMAASYGGTVVDGVGGDEDTFVIRLPQSRVRVLAVDPHVKSVAPTRFRAEPQAVVETVNWTSGVSYSYDGTGNITQIGSDAFSYDGLNRLSQAKVNGVSRTYQYDAYGNRTACTQFGPNDCQAFSINTAENKNRITEATYDPAGNVTGLSGHTYSYDPLNMMTRDTFGQLSQEFVYTADDERIATYTVGASWSWTVRGTDGKVLREFTSSDGPAGPGTSAWRWTKDDIWRDGLLLASRQPDGANTMTYHYHLDHLGTPRRVTDQNDRIVGVHDYFAYGPELSGVTTEPSASTLKYTGHERDSWSSGSSDALDYMHTRYYSPWLGRFLSVDPLPGSRRRPQTWNRYAYAISNPLRYSDPTGLGIEDWIKHLFGISTTDPKFTVYAEITVHSTPLPLSATEQFVGNLLVRALQATPQRAMLRAQADGDAIGFSMAYWQTTTLPFIMDGEGGAEEDATAEGGLEDAGTAVVEVSEDLQPTLDRIESGESFPHRNDGSVFSNREGRLPSQAEGYYHEYVHPTPGTKGAGPQRIVKGAGGEIFYTPDHYATFIRLK